MDNVFQTGRLRASQPWSTMIVELDRIVKKFFPTSIEEFNKGITTHTTRGIQERDYARQKRQSIVITLRLF
jgi:hypothetical protein